MTESARRCRAARDPAGNGPGLRPGLAGTQNARTGVWASNGNCFKD